MFQATRLSGKIELIPLLHGKISIANIQLYGFDINLYQNKEKESANFQFLIDKFAKKSDKPSNPDLRINSILIRRGKLSWHRPYRPLTPGQFNPDHIELDKISATLSLKQYTRDSLNLNVKKVSFEEHSGIQLKQFSFKLTANRQEALLEHATVELPHSQLTLSPITFHYDIPDTLDNHTFKHLEIKGQIDKCIFHPSDFSPFYTSAEHAQRLRHFPPLYVSAQFGGDLNEFKADRLTFHTEDGGIRLDCPVTISRLQNISDCTVQGDIQTLQINHNGMQQIADCLDQHKNYVLALGTLHANGNISYHPKHSTGNLSLHTDVGQLHLAGTLTDRNRFKATIHSQGIMLDKLTGREKDFGNLAFNLSGTGMLHPDNPPTASLEGTINNFSYRKHEYQDIALYINHKEGTFNGKVSVQDIYMGITAEGSLNLKTAPFVKADIAVSHFNPHALSLTSKYEGRTFNGNIQADLRGSNVENMEGHISLNDFLMSDGEEEYTTGPVVLEAHDESGVRDLSFTSDFIQAEMKGSFKFKTLVAHSKQLLHRYIPTFIQQPTIKKDISDDVTLVMRIKNTEPIEKIFDIPLQVPETGHVTGHLNSQTNQLDLNASFPAIDYNGHLLSQLQISTEQSADSISCTVGFKKQIGKSPVDFLLYTRAANDNLYTSINWTNYASSLYKGNISTTARFQKNEENRKLTDIEFHPSQIIVNDSIWNVHASHVLISPDNTNIDHFKIGQKDYYLTLNGNVSPHTDDSLMIDLKNINLEYIFNLINFHAVDFTGYATGKVYATNLLRSPIVDARLHVQDFTFNRAYLGNMNLYGGWEKEKNGIYLNAHIADPAHQSMTTVEGDIRIGAPPKGGLDLMINTEKIDLAFLNKYTDGIFTNLQGRASGWTRVFGPFKGINLEGDMLVNEARMKVNATEVDYHLVNDSVILRPDNILFRNAIIYDHIGSPGTQSHYAVVNGALQHTNLSRMRFDFNIEAHNILGYDVKDFGENVFCGTAYATGNIRFNGQPGDLNINIDARPESNTLFVYNLSSPTTLTDNQFITYKNPKEEINEEHTHTNQPVVAAPTTDMRINFNLDLNPSATMKILMDAKSGDYISLNGHGNIRANYYNKGKFTMYGTYTVDHGLYKLSLQDVIRKDFIFNPGGTIIFGGDPIQADLNLQAVYTVPSVSLNDLSARSTFSQNNVRVNCLMNLGGKAQAPQIGFDFDLPNVNEDEKQMVRSLISTEEEKNMQVIYLLGIGRFYTYDYNNTEQSQSSVAMKSLLSSTLSGQLNQMFSSILGNNSNWNIGTNLSTGEVGWSDMDVEGLLSGRLLNNRLLINGNFGYRDNTTTSTNNNFIGDFDIQWLLTQSGNISLKAYSKTNDRYFTKSTLTTQGIGIGLKRDFNTWRDILRLFTPKKRRKPLQQ